MELTHIDLFSGIGGFVLAAPCIRNGETGWLELKNPFIGNVKLAFAVFTRDKYFRDRSDLPYDPPGEYVYYFNNLSPNERRTRLLLSQCSVKESERVGLHAKQFSGTLAKNERNEIILPRVLIAGGKEYRKLNMIL